MMRQATLKDCQSIAELHVQSWQEAYRGILPEEYLESLDVNTRARNWENIIASNHSTVLLDVGDKGLRGFAGACPSRDKDATDTVGEIAAIYYSPSCWGKGYASKLIDHTIATLNHSGFIEITVWVLEKNNRAVNFYNKHGFTYDCHDKPVEIGGSRQTEVRMRLGHSKQGIQTTGPTLSF